MNSGRRIYRVLVVLTALAMLASCVPVPITPIPPTPGSPGVADLIAQLADQDAGVRLRAAYQLGELWPTDEDAVKALIQAAGDPDSQVRTVATYALGKTHQATDQAVFTLVNRLSDDSPQVRYSAARALGNLGAPAKAALHRGLLDRLSLKNEADENVRYAVAEAIAKIGPDSGALPALMGALTDNNWYVRHYAGLALQQLDPKTLMTFVTSEDFLKQGWDLRSRVTDLLSQMSQKGIPEPELKSAFLNQDNDSTVLALVAVALIRMAPESRPFLEDALKQLIASDERMGVQRTITALGYSGKAALPALKAALTDLDSNFSASTATALARIGSDAIPELVGVLRSGNEQAAHGAADALAMIGTLSIPHVLPLLEDTNDAVRLRAVQLLGSIGEGATSDVAQLAASVDPTNVEKCRRQRSQNCTKSGGIRMKPSWLLSRSCRAGSRRSGAPQRTVSQGSGRQGSPRCPRS